MGKIYWQMMTAVSLFINNRMGTLKRMRDLDFVAEDLLVCLCYSGTGRLKVDWYKYSVVLCFLEWMMRFCLGLY